MKLLVSLCDHVRSFVILTTIDTGTRVARFLVGEFGGRFYRKLEEPNWCLVL